MDGFHVRFEDWSDRKSYRLHPCGCEVFTFTKDRDAEPEISFSSCGRAGHEQPPEPA